jgi:hypothetical protein
MSDQPSNIDLHFGLCPTCHRTDGYLNVGRGHWFVCHEHRAKWFAGANLISSWRDQSEAEQRAAYERVGLHEYRHVEPWYGDRPIESGYGLLHAELIG